VTTSPESYGTTSIDLEEISRSTKVAEITAERSPSVTDITSPNSHATTIVNLEEISKPTSGSSIETTMAGSPPIIHTTATQSNPPTTIISGETDILSSLTTTEPRQEQTSTTTAVGKDNDAPTSKTTSAEPAELTGCSATCTLIEDYQQHYDDFGCNLNGVFTNTNAIYGFGSDDNPNMQFYARDVE